MGATDRLEDKLREILRSGAFGNYGSNADGEFKRLDWTRTPSSYFDDYIDEIMQAFKDAGYIPYANPTKLHWMTGEEWYAAFEEELRGTAVKEGDVASAVYMCKVAAKKASRLE